ncbi:flavin reductase family protein [Bradyrhizobium sp.]|jgi:flavin reductase (DIM6/NTAB) family NADH-FMN oxidoreductase RutF|uniref:flavin reductase family protein n=1 Tax=Bradyrhizobium sp. TaxID=376 RepID=UPI002E02685F|nr:flavin reductase family protein [Bradyrhizobium sp.]
MLKRTASGGNGVASSAPNLARDPGTIYTDFRKAMRRLTSTVSIIATVGDGDGDYVGMVATTVNSLCSDPPAIVACLSRAASIFGPLMSRKRFSVNLLEARQANLIPIFSGQEKGAARFRYGQWENIDGLPCLVDGQATLLCRLDGSFAYGSHDVIVGRIEAARVADQISPLLWQNGKPAVSRALD